MYSVCFTKENMTEQVKLIELGEKILTMYRQRTDTFNVTNSLVQYLWEIRNVQQLCKAGNKAGKRSLKALKTAGGPITLRQSEWKMLFRIYPFDKVEIGEIQLCFDNINAIWNELENLE